MGPMNFLLSSATIAIFYIWVEWRKRHDLAQRYLISSAFRKIEIKNIIMYLTKQKEFLSLLLLVLPIRTDSYLVLQYWCYMRKDQLKSTLLISETETFFCFVLSCFFPTIYFVIVSNIWSNKILMNKY